MEKVKRGKNKISKEWRHWLQEVQTPTSTPAAQPSSAASSVKSPPPKPQQSPPPQPQQSPPPKPQKSAAEIMAEKEQAELKKKILSETTRILQYKVTAVRHEFFILNLPDASELNDVKEVIKKLSLLLHPDKSINIIQDPEEQERVRKAFMAAKDAADKAKKTIEDRRAAAAAAAAFYAPPPPQPAQPRPRGSQLGKRCAHARCDFAVTHLSFGGFCCKWCHLTSELGDPIRHGRKCHGRISQNLERAHPVPPDVPMKSERVVEC